MVVFGRHPHMNKISLPAVEKLRREAPSAERFRFRFLVRGDAASRLIFYATASLNRCHPRAAIVVVDANDEPTVNQRNLPDGASLVYLPPPQDEVANCLGRGSTKHIFYWRHSPAILAAIGPAQGRFDVHADSDMLFLRPFDLGALIPYLEVGRIAMAIDRSTQDYYQFLEKVAPCSGSTAFPVAGSRGPMVQGGLMFRNPYDDGGLLQLLWEYACRDARTNGLAHAPWDDMAFLSNLLGHSGDLWGRLLPLGHEWNFISNTERDGGVFSYVAHYGGSPKDVDFIAGRYTQLYPSVRALQDLQLWQREPDIVRVGYGRVGLAGESGYDALSVTVTGKRIENALSLHPPFCASWRVHPSADYFSFTPSLNDTCRFVGNGEMRVRLLCYVDGAFRQEERIVGRTGAQLKLQVRDAESVTLIGVTAEPDYCHFVLVNPRWE